MPGPVTGTTCRPRQLFVPPTTRLFILDTTIALPSATADAIVTEVTARPAWASAKLAVLCRRESCSHCQGLLPRQETGG